jgi:hypothetical protein
VRSKRVDFLHLKAVLNQEQRSDFHSVSRNLGIKVARVSALALRLLPTFALSCDRNTDTVVERPSFYSLVSTLNFQSALMLVPCFLSSRVENALDYILSNMMALSVVTVGEFYGKALLLPADLP